MELSLREVQLHLGPNDGGFGVCSHDTTVVGETLEIYVHDGSEKPDSFVHARSALDALPEDVRLKEYKLYAGYVADRVLWDKRMIDHFEQHHTTSTEPPPIVPPEIPDWRMNAWWQLHRYGQL